MGSKDRVFIELTFQRATETARPEAFVFEPQGYTRYDAHRAVETARFAWDDQLLRRLAELQESAPDDAVRVALGVQLREFFEQTRWTIPELELTDTVPPEGGPHCLTIAAGAAELYALPWELASLPVSRRHLADLPNLLVRYEWPGLGDLPARPIASDKPSRILFAWSAAGGVIPADEHARWIDDALRCSSLPGVRLATLPHVSGATLEAELAKDGGPTVLHLLCHGAVHFTSEGPSAELIWNGSADASPTEGISASRLGNILDKCPDLRLVVLCACLGGDHDPAARSIGSLAQMIHRRGVPAVIASRYPFSVQGSVRLTRVFYRALLVEGSPLESAVVKARLALLSERGKATETDDGDSFGRLAADGYALQLYARSFEAVRDENGSFMRRRIAAFYPFGQRGRPPAPSPAVQRGKLPAKPSCFLGRDDKLRPLIDALLASSPAPTVILGPAGIGKSALTLMALHDSRVASQYGENRFFVRLDTAKTASDVAAAIRGAIGLPIGPDPRGDVLSFLSRAKAALALDNAETPWEGEDRDAVEELFAELSALPGLALVASLRGSTRPSPFASALTLSLERLKDEIATDIFCEIARTKPDDPALMPLIAEMDGVPLAVTLLAMTGEGVSLTSLSAEWDRIRTALLSRPGAKPHRLSSWAVSLELSWTSPRMTEGARRLARLLGALPDGVAEVDLEALLPREGHSGALVLQRVGLARSEAGRLKVLAPVREHLALEHRAEGEDLRRAMELYGNLAETLGPKVFREGGGEALARLLPEAGNLDSMIRRGLEGGEVSRWVDRATALRSFAQDSGHSLTAMLERARAAAHGSGDVRREAICTKSLGDIALVRSHHDDARARFKEALALYAQVSDVVGEADCIFGFGDIALARSQYDEAGAHFKQALALCTEVGAAPGQARCIGSLGVVALRRSQHDEARACFLRARALYTKAGDLGGESACILCLGEIALARSQHDEARMCFEQALPLCVRIGDVAGEAACIQSLGDIALAGSQHDEARARFEEALERFSRIPERHSMGMIHRRLARLASDPLERARHINAARSAWTSVKYHNLVAELDAEFGPSRTMTSESASAAPSP